MPALRIIGNGRAGSALALALERRGWELRGLLGRADDPTEAARGVDLCVIATPDRSVGEVVGAIRPQPTTVLAHLSGVLGLEVLAPHERRATLHPLVAITDASRGADALTGGAWFAVSGDPLARDVVATLGGRWFELDDERRGLYHAAACVASNHTVVVLAQAERLAVLAGVPFTALGDLARGTVENVCELGAEAALTGPAARGDTSTITMHLASIAPLGQREVDLYRALSEAASSLGRARGKEASDDPGPRVITTVEQWRKSLDAERAAGRSIGLVPTMGALHRGHESLIERAAQECDVAAVTIFVNPLQFGPSEDLASYPRDLESDVEIAGRSGAAYVFAPTVQEMYPQTPLSTVSAGALGSRYEGAKRPGHFDGVATVVTKLFSQAGPSRAYFGEKDFQQLAIVRRLVADLSLPIEVIGCPIVREPDGLALSSRNVYLTPAERAVAPTLYRALVAAAETARRAAADGTEDPSCVRAAMAETVHASAVIDLDYAEVVDAVTLEPATTLSGELRLLIAARLGRARLIDNMGVSL